MKKDSVCELVCLGIGQTKRESVGGGGGGRSRRDACLAWVTNRDRVGMFGAVIRMIEM